MSKILVASRLGIEVNALFGGFDLFSMERGSVHSRVGASDSIVGGFMKRRSEPKLRRWAFTSTVQDTQGRQYRSRESTSGV